MANEVKAAHDHCRRIAKEQAKNFYYAFRTLPAAKRRAIYATYAFCRACDEIADDNLDELKKRKLFAQTRHDLAESLAGRAHDPLFIALEDAASDFGIPREYLEEVIEGVEMDLVTTRYQTFDDLLGYTHKVASVVGLISIQIFGYTDPAAKGYAIDLGHAMQLTNILRDVKEDSDRGRIYIPLEDLASFGYSEHELTHGVNNDAFRELMSFQAARARRFFDGGERLLPLVEPNSRGCLAILRAVYSGILDRIQASGFDVFERRIGLSSTEKLILTARLWAEYLIPSIPLPRR